MHSPPIIQLPGQFGGANVSHVINGVIQASPNGLPPVIYFDFATLRFIRPVGVVILSNLVYWLHRRGTVVHFLHFDRPSHPLIFLDDAQFFHQHMGRKVRQNAVPRSTTRPLIQVTDAGSHDWLESDLLPWLASRLSLSLASFSNLKTSISEIFNNIRDHTDLNIGSVFVQFFPRENRINIAVSDFGPGIPATVARVQPGLSDNDAIKLAVREGFSSRSIPTNQGLGLDYLIRTVVLTNGGTVTVYSLNAIVQFSRAGTQTSAYEFPNVGFIPGTTIDICLRTDTMEAVAEEREDLIW